MIDLKKPEIWLLAGSQQICGTEELKAVSLHSREIAAALAGIESLLIDARANLRDFKKELRLNEASFALCQRP